MKLKTLFFLLALLLLSAWGILFFFVLKEKGTLVYVGEAVVTVSLIVLVYFYRKVVQPLNSIANGMDLLREQDFSSRLAPVRQAEADRIVDMFNRMMDQLKNERLRLREQNHFLDLLINVSPMGVVILDFDGKISMLNMAAMRTSSAIPALTPARTAATPVVTSQAASPKKSAPRTENLASAEILAVWKYS